MAQQMKRETEVDFYTQCDSASWVDGEGDATRIGVTLSPVRRDLIDPVRYYATKRTPCFAHEVPELLRQLADEIEKGLAP